MRAIPPTFRPHTTRNAMRLKLEARAEPSRLMGYLSPVLAAALTIVAGFILFSALGKNPVQAFYTFFIHPIRDLNGVTELLLKASPLMLIGVGLACGYRANVWNIGAEGQLVLGAIFAGGVALYFHGSENALVLPAMFVAGALGGMVWAAIPALLRTRFNTNEILVSLMLVYVALGYVFLNRSFLGYQLRVAGLAPDAAKYAGFNANRMVWLGMLVGGACAGIAGMGEVAGPIGQLLPSVSPGYGFAAIIVAFVGRLHPVGILLASLLMSLLYLGGEAAQMGLNLPSAMTGLFQGMLLFFLLGSDVFINYRIKLVRPIVAATMV